VFYFLNVFDAFSVIIIKVLSYFIMPALRMACVTVLYSSLSLFLSVCVHCVAGDY